MTPSITRLRMTMVAAGVGAAFKHLTSRDYPEDWDLAFHIQFAITKRILQVANLYSVEEVILPRDLLT
jgi:hypothetical protein